MNDDGSFWYSVVKEKYANSHSEWSVQRAATISGWWRSLWSCAEEEDWFEGRVVRKVGNGKNTSFWNDSWGVKGLN